MTNEPFVNTTEKQDVFLRNIADILTQYSDIDLCLFRPTLDEFVSYFEPNGVGALYGVNHKHKTMMRKHFSNMLELLNENSETGKKAWANINMNYKQNELDIALVCYVAKHNLLVFVLQYSQYSINNSYFAVMAFYDRVSLNQSIKLAFTTSHYPSTLCHFYNHSYNVEYCPFVAEEIYDSIVKNAKIQAIDSTFKLSDYISCRDVFVTGIAKNGDVRYSDCYKVATYCYQVVGIKGNNCIMLREIKYKIDKDSLRYEKIGRSFVWSGFAKPLRNRFVNDKIITKRINKEFLINELSRDSNLSTVITDTKGKQVFERIENAFYWRSTEYKEQH